MRILAIVEKPAVAAELAKALGGTISRHDGYLQVGDVRISWAIGHLLENKKPDEYDPKYVSWDLALLPFIPDHLEIRPSAEKDANGRDKVNSDGSIKFDAGRKRQLEAIRRLLRETDSVVVAGDAAREGQLIVDEILEYLNYRGPATRLWLQEMNLPAIRQAWANMRPNSERRNLYLAALGRSSLDFLIGMNCTRAYTQACQAKGYNVTLHIGRVQTPTICMVVARDLQIETFIAKDFYVLRVKMEHAAGAFVSNWVIPKEAPFLDEDGRVIDRKVVEAVAEKVRGKTGSILSYVTTPKTNSPPLPFSLGDLQKTVFRMYGLSALKTLEVAQALYEKHKLISYPRTDYSHLPRGDHAYGPAIIAAVMSNFGDQWVIPGTPDFSLVSPAWDDSQIGDHFAIRPTDRSGYDLGLLSPMELNVYKLICKQFLAQFYPPYKYDSTTVEIECLGEKFRANGKLEKQLGWKVLFPPASGVREVKDDDQKLPLMEAGDLCLLAQPMVEAKKTSPPKRYDTASLLDAMEKALKDKIGIGTPATRAGIIEFAIKREYLQEVTEGKKKFYVSTERARFLYKIVPDWLKKPDLTAYFEDLLKQVEEGKLAYEKLIARQRQFIEKLMDDVKSGKVADSMPAPGTYSQPKLVGKKGTRVKSIGKMAGNERPGQRLTKWECTECGKPMAERNGSNGPFLGCSGYPGCKSTEPMPGSEQPRKHQSAQTSGMNAQVRQHSSSA